MYSSTGIILEFKCEMRRKHTKWEGRTREAFVANWLRCSCWTVFTFQRLNTTSLNSDDIGGTNRRVFEYYNYNRHLRQTFKYLRYPQRAASYVPSTALALGADGIYSSNRQIIRNCSRVQWTTNRMASRHFFAVVLVFSISVVSW